MGTDNITESDVEPGEVPAGPNNNELEEGAEGGEIGTTKHRTDNEYLALDASSDGTEKGAVDQDDFELNRGDIETEDGELGADMVVDMDLVDSPVREVHVQVAEVVKVAGDVNNVNSGEIADNCSLDLHDGTISRNSRSDRSHVSGVKRTRMTYEQQSSVHVTFNCLTRASKQKLEGLLQEWSEWHTQSDPSLLDSDEVIESGEETYFPALRVGTEKSSAVSFWIENQTRKQSDNRSTPLNDNCVPLYDRGFAKCLTSAGDPCNVEGGLVIVDDAARCFNCGSYSHSLKECSRPRDHVAISNSRRLYKSKLNKNSASCSATRYYENSSGGKFDGLEPGSLDHETRQLLGLAELDPPPWLARMRELGYPPGYIDPDDEDQPSGITIFADGDDRLEQEDGEIIGMDNPEAPKRKSVVFPGINAPIPENANERLWGVQSSGFDRSNHQSRYKMDHFSEPIHRQHYLERKRFNDFLDDGPPGVEWRRSSDFIDDAPPGVDLAISPSGYPPRERSTLVYEDFRSPGLSPYSSSRERYYQQKLGYSCFVYGSDDWRDHHLFHRHHSWR